MIAPGLRVLDVRDAQHHVCYLVFIADHGADAAAGDPSGDRLAADAAGVRDQRLRGLSAAFEAETSPFAGTSTNALKYQWEAATAQVDFALTILQYAVARLERHVDEAGSARMAIAVQPQPCTNAAPEP